jgi:hypothetical protein
MLEGYEKDIKESLKAAGYTIKHHNKNLDSNCFLIKQDAGLIVVDVSRPKELEPGRLYQYVRVSLSHKHPPNLEPGKARLAVIEKVAALLKDGAGFSIDEIDRAKGDIDLFRWIAKPEGKRPRYGGREAMPKHERPKVFSMRLSPDSHAWAMDNKDIIKAFIEGCAENDASAQFWNNKNAKTDYSPS